MQSKWLSHMYISTHSSRRVHAAHGNAIAILVLGTKIHCSQFRTFRKIGSNSGMGRTRHLTPPPVTPTLAWPGTHFRSFVRPLFRGEHKTNFCKVTLENLSQWKIPTSKSGGKNTSLAIPSDRPRKVVSKNVRHQRANVTPFQRKCSHI
jgi:hypothetical protein